ncbi:hypothetical protein Acr_17g0005690 [Actinidia rufa]|uniref:Uncharacterized protein n=1 Tax=Actinidia rufa TaxID=165716 RepID=A0A7J0G2I4_9ERIC|nr:hypothetical protein Acr_17g0005690 [Actinidia rufa]
MPTKTMQGATGGFSTAPMNSDAGLPSISRQLTNESISGVVGRREKARGVLPNTSTILAQAWKEDMDVVHLLPLLFEYFDESVFSFIPMLELSFFV